jgi:hypothetical protein
LEKLKLLSRFEQLPIMRLGPYFKLEINGMYCSRTFGIPPGISNAR